MGCWVNYTKKYNQPMKLINDQTDRNPAGIALTRIDSASNVRQSAVAELVNHANSSFSLAQSAEVGCVSEVA